MSNEVKEKKRSPGRTTLGARLAYVPTNARTTPYGPVLIMKGKYKGTIGFYDDDDGGAIVYQQLMHEKGPYLVLPHNYLMALPIDSVAIVPKEPLPSNWKEISEQMGFGMRVFGVDDIMPKEEPDSTVLS